MEPCSKHWKRFLIRVWSETMQFITRYDFLFMRNICHICLFCVCIYTNSIFFIYVFLCTFMGFPGDSGVKNPYTNAGDKGYASLIPRLGRSPGGGHGNPLQYSCLENPQGQMSLVGYSPWGWKELEMAEWLSTEQHILCSVSIRNQRNTLKDH